MRYIIALAAAALLAAGCAVSEPTPVQPPEASASQQAETAGGTESAPQVGLTAKRVPYRKHEFASGGPYSCVRATVTNKTDSNVEVNPFFFAITDSGGEKRQAAVGAAEGEFDSLTLAPGEKASGTVCAETKTPASVLTFTDGLSEAARARVAS